MLHKLQKQWSDSLLTYLVNHRNLMIMTLSLLLGVLFGSVILKQDSSLNFLSTHFENFLTCRTVGSFSGIFISSFSTSVVYLFITYLSGIFIFGFLPTLLIPTMRGLGIGAVISYLYCTYQLKGAAFVILIVLPVSFFHSLLLLVACKESFTFSFQLSCVYFGGQPQIGAKTAFKKYNLRYLILLFLSVLICIMDGFLSIIFINLFGF